MGCISFCLYAIVITRPPRIIPSRKVLEINLHHKTLSTGVYFDETKQIKWKKSSTNLMPDALVYNPGYTFNKYMDASGTHKFGNVTIKPTLCIYGSPGTHFICDGGLSDRELWWLGKELSDFLGLELQVIHQIPHQKI
jgi:hypothetical protein